MTTTMPRGSRAILFGLAFSLIAFVSSDVRAASREAVLAVLDEVATRHASEGFRVWANEGDELPVEEGEEVEFHFDSNRDVYLTALYLDADGNLVLIYPAPGGTPLAGREAKVLAAGEATTPYGQESLFVVASEEPITREALGIDSRETFAVLQLDAARQAAERLRDVAASTDVRSARVDLHIVPAQRTGQGLTRGGIVQYFTEATRSLHRPKLSLEINFETDSAVLLDDARADLDVVGQALADERLGDKKFRLVGHTDHRGEESYNQALSENRAEVAREYLVERYGIAAERLDSLGLGESVPMMSGTDERAMRRNRRVELELMR